MRQTVLSHAINRLVQFQIRRPWYIILFVILSLLPTGFLASKLGLRTSFSELLPENKPSVVEMRRISQRLSSQSTLTVVAQGSNTNVLKQYVDQATPRILALGPEYVAGVDTGTREVEQFFEANKHLYAKLEDIRELHDIVLARYDAAVAKAAGFDLELDDDEDETQAPTSTSKTSALDKTPSSDNTKLDQLLNRLEKQGKTAQAKKTGVDGYYIGENGTLAVLLVRTPLGSGDEKAFELRHRIEALTDELGFKQRDPSFQIHFTGNLITSAEQQQVVKRDLTEVGTWGVGLVLGIVFLYFLRFRTVAAMGITITVGLTWSFAVAKLTVGYLNTATGFLVSIIAGNGINFSIIMMARYIEARRDEKAPVAAAIEIAHRDTRTATLGAAGAAMIAYGSLAVTDFRGFRHFGIIGGAGMILCWVATYLLLPALLVVSERVSPMFDGEAPWRTKLKGVYGVPFAWATQRFPKLVAILGVCFAVVSVWSSIHYFRQDPMEYDLANIRNDRTSESSAGKLSVRVDKIVGRLGQDGRAIVVDRIDQVKPLVTELEKRRQIAPEKAKPFDRVVSIFDLLPDAQEEKLKLLAETKDKLERARARHAITDADWARIAPHVPAKLIPIGIAQLPEGIVRSFTEKNGTRGTIVYIVPTTGRSVYDAHYLREFADAFREVRLPTGELIRGTGDPVIFSDMLINVGEDAPKAIALSLLGTILVILIVFRGRPAGWVALGCLLVGITALTTFLDFRNIKLNFLNFVALPISIGVGADYTINIMKRRELVGQEGLHRLLVETGGAVVLCSLTTQLGYLALMFSINGAVRSFGLAAAVGEITTLFSAVLFLPALLAWHSSRKLRA